MRKHRSIRPVSLMTKTVKTQGMANPFLILKNRYSSADRLPMPMAMKKLIRDLVAYIDRWSHMVGCGLEWRVCCCMQMYTQYMNQRFCMGNDVKTWRTEKKFPVALSLLSNQLFLFFVGGSSLPISKTKFYPISSLLIIGLFFYPTAWMVSQNEFSHFVVEENQNGKRHCWHPPIQSARNQ